MARTEREVRLEVFNSFKDLYASAPIRLMSRTVNAMRAMGYNDLASAIGDLDRRTVPPDDPEELLPQLADATEYKLFVRLPKIEFQSKVPGPQGIEPAQEPN